MGQQLASISDSFFKSRQGGINSRKDWKLNTYQYTGWCYLVGILGRVGDAHEAGYIYIYNIFLFFLDVG